MNKPNQSKILNEIWCEMSEKGTIGKESGCTPTSTDQVTCLNSGTFFNHLPSLNAAICHAVVLAARSINIETRKSVLYNYKTTSLLKSQELLAYNLTRLWLKDYYLTYPEQTVEDEVISVLSDKNKFLKGPTPLLQDSNEYIKRGL